MDDSLRILMLGEPKAGKTLTLSALADAGWNVRYLDFDDNSAPLTNFTKPANRGNIHIVKCLDTFNIIEAAGKKDGRLNTEIRMLKASAWPTMRSAILDKWPTDGSIPTEWDPTKNVLVFDSLSAVADSKVRMNMWANGRDGTRKQFADFTQTQDTITGLIKTLKIGIRCPIIFIGHLKLTGPDLELDMNIEDQGLRERQLSVKLDASNKIPWLRGPITVGKAQANTLASDFSGVMLVEAKPGIGREILLTPQVGLALGLPFPGLRERYPNDTGMKAIMEAWLASRSGGQ